MCKRVLQLHKIIDEKTPAYLREKLPANRNVIINLPNVFREIRCRTDRYQNSFFPNAVSHWNNIISDFKDLPSFTELKKHVISLIRPSPKETFNVFQPNLLRYLFQLRLGLSRLRRHKNNKAILLWNSRQSVLKKNPPEKIVIAMKKLVNDNKYIFDECALPTHKYFSNWIGKW